MSLLALLHLCSVTVVAWTELTHSRLPAMVSAIRTYQDFTGPMQGYSFFAPAVLPDIKAVFVLENTEGTESSIVPFATGNPDVVLRYNSLIAACMKNESSRDFFAQSWAASILGTRLEAARVLVVVKALETPTMSDYRAGRRSTWQLLYAGEFARRARTAPP